MPRRPDARVAAAAATAQDLYRQTGNAPLARALTAELALLRGAALKRLFLGDASGLYAALGLNGADTPAAALSHKCFLLLPETACPENDALDFSRTLPLWRALPSVPASAREVGELYEELLALPLEHENTASLLTARRRGGVFFTPATLIREMFKTLAPRPEESLCDPSMGTGHFLLGAIEYFRSQLTRPQLLNWARTCLYGVELNPHAARLARLCLWLELSEPGESVMLPAEHFRSGDALLTDEFAWNRSFPAIFPIKAGENDAGFACMIGNPPYDVLTNFQACPEHRIYAGRLRASDDYPLTSNGQLNLYRCFIERTLQMTRPGGRLCLIVPATLSLDASTAPLREALLREHHADYFHPIPEGDPAFPGIRQATVIFRAHTYAGAARQVQIESGDERFVLHEEDLRQSGYRIQAARPLDWQLLRWLREHCPRKFSDIAASAVGEADQTFFSRFFRDEPPGELLLRGCHLQPFYADLNPTPSAQRFIDAAGFLAAKGRVAAQIRAQLSTPRVAQLGIRNLRCRTRLIAAVIPPGIYCGNSVNLFYPVPASLFALAQSAAPAFIAALLNCRLYDHLFRLGSGNNNINLREINPLPFPADCPAATGDRIVSLYERCAEAAARSKENELTLYKGQLDSCIEDWFGLPATLRAVLG